MVLVIGTGLAIGAAAAVRTLARDMREAAALARRPKQPWDV